jgi:RNA 3'-terminal phosphate cyclase (ATP)
MKTDLRIDGSLGQGGGQILRTALSLSCCLGRPFEISRIRASRRRPGLQPQHLAAVRAAAAISQARVSGDQRDSRELRFVPGRIKPGHYRFGVGTAGSNSLVLQTVLPALQLAEDPSELLLEGGTHNPLAPPFEFLQHAFLPVKFELHQVSGAVWRVRVI